MMTQDPAVPAGWMVLLRPPGAELMCFIPEVQIQSEKLSVVESDPEDPEADSISFIPEMRNQLEKYSIVE